MSAAPRPLAPPVARPARNPWAIAFTVTLATFMEVLDTSIANVSLPHIAGGLSASVDESTWVLTAYLVANAIVLPLSAWVSGFIGRKRFYMTCVALFTISSLFCGFAPTLATLVVFRIIQGAGGGGLQPSEQAILADTFPGEKFGMAFAMYGMAVVLAPAIGPTLGGYITDHFNWRWIFFINVPIGIISLLLTYRMVEDPPYLKKEERRARSRANIDFIGLGFIVLGLGCLQVVLDRGQELDWFGSRMITWFIITSAVSLVAFVIWEWRQKNPILELRLFRERTFATAILMMFILGFGLYGSTILLPLYLQQLMGYTSQLAGMVLSPGGFAIALMMPIVGTLVSKVQARWLIGVGFLITGFAFLAMSNINPNIDFHTAMVYRIQQSIGLAFLFVPITTIAYLGIAPNKNNQVSSIISLARNIGGSVGIALVTTMVARRSQFHQDRIASHVTGYDHVFRNGMSVLTSNLMHQGYSSADAANQAYGRIYGLLEQQSMALAYIDVIWVFAVAALCMVPLVLLMKKNDPGKVTMAH
jgi:MFS transporter, DHA2 family, multidrug resistance protein